MNLSNLPPGVTDSMLPGNRPEDIEWEAFFEWLDNDCSLEGFTTDEAKEIWQLGKKHFRKGARP